jgi:hypothetical protein
MIMKVKPKEILVNLPIVLLFDGEDEIAKFASNINALIHGKVKVKCEELGVLNNQFVGIFYLQRNNEYGELRQQFINMIENEEVLEHNRALPRKNGGVECDVEAGPCACGAWHNPDEKNIIPLKEVTIKKWDHAEHSVLLFLIDSIISAPEKAGELLALIYQTHSDTGSRKLLDFLKRLDDASYDTAQLLSTATDIKEELR